MDRWELGEEDDEEEENESQEKILIGLKVSKERREATEVCTIYMASSK